jgi:hypothetical protein
MTLPCVLHGIFTAVEITLAGAFEGEVRSVLSILRMFEESFRRPFLKFERFSSLRKQCHRRDITHALSPGQRSRAAKQSRARNTPYLEHAFVPPSFGNRPFTIRDEFNRVCIVISRHPRSARAASDLP